MTQRRVRAYIGLGANVGDARATLTWAVGALAALPGARLRGVSRLYVTAPVGVTDQPDFHNAVAALEVPAGADPATGALALLMSLKDLERQSGRQTRERWGPRELDLDLLIFGRARISVERPPGARSGSNDAGADADMGADADAGADADTAPATSVKLLVVPHVEAHERLFVLAPLADLAPRLVPPGWGEAVTTARVRRESVEGPGAVRPIGTWDDTGGRWLRR